MMDYHLNRTIRLSEESEYKNLYPWSLQEFNDKDEKVGMDQIPWDWSLQFISSELRHSSSIKIERLEESENDIKNFSSVEESESIFAILHPGICIDGQWLERDTSYSMFGTDRKINDFALNIYKIDEDDDNKESCNLWGCVSYTAEVDFRDETMDDCVQININLLPERFNLLAKLVQSQRIDIVAVSLRRASGFYSEWSPSVSTESIKILTGFDDDQKVLIPEDCKISPPRLGQVDEFELNIVRRNKLNPKQDLRSININKLFDAEEADNDFVEEFARTEPDANTLLLNHLARNEAVTKKLRTPLWCIFIILLLLFLTQL